MFTFFTEIEETLHFAKIKKEENMATRGFTIMNH